MGCVVYSGFAMRYSTHVRWGVPVWVPGMLLCSLLMAGACEKTESPVAEGSPGTEETTPSSSPDGSPSPTAPTVDQTATTITGSSIGVAELGMSFGDLKQALPTATFEVRSPFMVDFDAIAISQGTETLFYILYFAGDSFDDTAPIQGLLTENPAFRTPDGIGPGSPIAEGVAAYGAPTLSYNIDNESREYVRFTDHPSPSLAFRTGTGAEAGIYPDITASFHETTEYQPEAVIQSVMLVCLSDGCVTTSP